MFVSRLASGLVFASGAGVLKAAVADESLVLLGLGLGAAVIGVLWFGKGLLAAQEARAAQA